MDIKDKSKEELISELQELRQENNVLKALCDKVNSGHKQAVEVLKQSEARLNAILLSMNDIVFEIDLNNCFEGYFAPKNKTLYVQPDLLIGKKVDEVLPKDVCVLLHQAIESINSGNPFQQFEYRLTIDSTIQWEHAVVTPRYNNSNEYVGVTAVCRNITERKRAEVELLESEKKYRMLAEGMANVVWILDIETMHFSYVSQSVEKLRGYTPEEVLSQPVKDSVTPESYKRVNDLMKIRLPHFLAQAEKKISYVDEIDQPHKNGSIIHTEVTTSYLLNEDGKIEVVGISRDITERKLAEEALNIRNQAFEDSIAAQSIADTTAKITHINEAFLRLWGYTSKEQVIGKSIGSFFFDHTDALPVVEALTSHYKWEGEFLAKRTDGTTFISRAFATSLRNSRGELIGYQSTNLDVTKERDAEKALKERERDLEKRNNFINTILENLAFGLAVTYMDSGVTNYINPAYSRVYGWPAEEMKDVESFFRLIYPNPVYCVQQMNMVLEDINSGDPERMHWVGFMITTKTGENRFIEAKNIPLPDQNLMISTAWDITDRMRAEEALHKNYKRLELAMQTANMAWWEMDIASGNVTFNPRKTEMLGYTPEKFNHYKDFMVLVHPEDYEKAMDAMRKHISGLAGCYEVEYRILTKSGEYKWFYDIGSVVENDLKGKPIKVTGLVLDISNRKKAEEEIESLNLKNELILKSAAEGILGLDLQGNHTFANPAAANMLGYKVEELLGRPCHGLWHHTRADGSPFPKEDCLALKVAQNGVEHRESNDLFWRKDGTCFPTEYVSTPIFEKGQVTGVVVTFSDITKRKLAEDLLTESELKYRSLIENSSDAIFCVDEKGQYQFVNHHFSSIFGKTPEYFVGKTIWDLYDKEFADKRFELTKRLFKFGISESIEVELPLTDKTLYFWATTNPIKDKTGKVILNLTRATDITELKKTQIELIKAKKEAEKNEREIIIINAELEQRISERTQELTKANKELEAFSYSVSHDLRTPLRAIKGFSQILMDDYGTKLDDEGKRICSVILDNSVRMGQLIKDLLEFSRFSRKELLRSEINMKELVTSIYNELTDMPSFQRIDFRISEICNAQADPHLIKQVWINLLSNAIKYSSKREKAIISVSSRQEYNKRIFCIKDNGVGFNMEYAKKLFGVFHRLHSEKDFEGTGLGLAIVHQIIHRHGGDVWAESEVDKGAAFYFSLPYNDEMKE